MKIKNIIILFLLTTILLISLVIAEESKVNTSKKEDKKVVKENLDNDDDDDYDYDDSDSDNENESDNTTNDKLENEKFEQKIHSVCEKHNIKKDSKITKAQLKEIFIEVFKEGQQKNEKENSNKKDDKYELLDTLLNEAFNRLTYDLEPEEITYDNIKNILNIKKASKIILDIYTQMMPEMFDDEL